MTIDEKILAIQDKKEQNAAVMKMLSMNLWRRVNAGYNIPRRQPCSQFKLDFPDDPALKIVGPKLHNRKRDAFTNYTEAVRRFDQMIKKPPAKPQPYVPLEVKMEQKRKRINERKAHKLAALKKVGAIPVTAGTKK